MDLMTSYAWEDIDSPGEVKFGEHFTEDVKDFDDAVVQTTKYIRASLGRQKYKFDEGRIKIHRIWNITEYSKSINRFKKHSKVDDIIRDKCLINRVNARSEFHKLDGIEVVNRIEKFLLSVNQPKIKAYLSTSQYRAACDIIQIYKDGHRTVMAELCARFGKTIWSAALGVEIDKDIIIVVSYVKTVFASFENDLIQFDQFCRYVHVDMQDPEYKDKIAVAIKEGKKVIAFLSMCGSSKRQERIDYLFNLNASRFVIIDEADFGVHTRKQSIPLIDARSDDDFVLLMTGTNSDRAVSMWSVDHMISVTYPELLIQKEFSKNNVKVF